MDQKERDEMLIRIDERVEDLTRAHSELQETAAENRQKTNTLENRIQRNETKLWIIGAGISAVSTILGGALVAFSSGLLG